MNGGKKQQLHFLLESEEVGWLVGWFGPFSFTTFYENQKGYYVSISGSVLEILSLMQVIHSEQLSFTK